MKRRNPIAKAVKRIRPKVVESKKKKIARKRVRVKDPFLDWIRRG